MIRRFKDTLIKIKMYRPSKYWVGVKIIAVFVILNFTFLKLNIIKVKWALGRKSVCIRCILNFPITFNGSGPNFPRWCYSSPWSHLHSALGNNGKESTTTHCSNIRWHIFFFFFSFATNKPREDPWPHTSHPFVWTCAIN